MPITSPLTCQTCGARLDAARSDGVCAICLFGEALEQELNETFGGHELCGEIARGGMGVVYRAMQREPRREVALKTLRGAELDSPEAQSRFRDEARTMAELEHPSILPIYHFGQQDGVLFFTMKLAAGGTLAERTTDYAGQWKKIAALIANVADAVQFAHEHGVLHRDIKPGNILFDEDDHVFVSDFGLAKLAERAEGGLTASAAMLGTPHYMAPEIAAHGLRAATTATDVWSLGVVLHELLAQKRPFKSESMPALLREISEREPDAMSLSVPSDLRIIASKALAKDPTRRYASARALADDLRCWLEGMPITARPTPGAERLWLWMKRNPALAGVSVLAVFGMAAAITSLAWGLGRAKQEAKNMAAARDQIATARDESQGQLRTALIERSRANRIARWSGWRDAGIESLRKAAEIRPGDDVRDEIIAHLAGFDLIREPEPSIASSPSNVPAGLSSALLNPWLEKFTDPAAKWVIKERGGMVIAVESLTGKQLASWPNSRLLGATDDGSVICVGYYGETPRFFQTGTWAEIKAIPPRKGVESAVLYPAAGDDLVAMSARGFSTYKNIMEVWNWKTGALVQSLNDEAHLGVSLLAWRGDWLVYGTAEGAARIEHLRSGRVRDLPGHTQVVRSGLFSRDGLFVFLWSQDGSSSMWQTDSSQLLLRSRTVHPVAWSDHDRVASALSTVKGRLLKPSFLRFISVQTRWPATVPNIDLSPDGRWLVATALGSYGFYDVATGRLIVECTDFPMPAKQGPKTVHFNATGDALLLGFHQGVFEARLSIKDSHLDVEYSENMAPPGLQGVLSIGLSPNQKWALLHLSESNAAGSSTGKNRSFLKDMSDRSSSWVEGNWTVGKRQLGNFRQIDSGGRWIVAPREGLVCDLENPAKLALHLKVIYRDASFSGDGRWLAFVSSSKMDIVDTKSWSVAASFNGDSTASTGASEALCWSPDDNLLAVVFPNSAIQLIESGTWKVVATLTGPMDASVASIVFSADGRTLAVARQSSVVELWDLSKLSEEMRGFGLKLNLPPPLKAVPIPKGLEGPLQSTPLPPLFPRTIK